MFLAGHLGAMPGGHGEARAGEQAKRQRQENVPPRLNTLPPELLLTGIAPFLSQQDAAALACSFRAARAVTGERFRSMKHLDLRSVQDPAGLAGQLLQQEAFIESLDLSGCAWLDASWAESVLPRLRGLKTLDLSRCPQVTDRVLRHLPPGLKSLDLSWCPQVSDDGMVHVNNLELDALMLDGCGISNRGLQLLSRQHLRELALVDPSACGWRMHFDRQGLDALHADRLERLVLTLGNQSTVGTADLHRLLGGARNLQYPGDPGWGDGDHRHAAGRSAGKAPAAAAPCGRQNP